MKPRVLKIDPSNIDPELLKQAAEVIRLRGLVAFPTETVYGLGADALDPKAVAGIFEAKKRPLDDPLIVHISDINDLYRLTREMPPEAEKLANSFWPGPLTMVLKKTDLVPDLITTGLDTVAVRMPSNTIAAGLITASGVPIAAPSANMFGRPSPTTAAHVIDDLNGRVDMVLDGGDTDIGVESTVVGFDGGHITVLRPGGVTIEDLRQITGDVEVYTGPQRTERTPGEYPQHYSPDAKVIVAENLPDQTGKVRQVAEEMSSQGFRIGIMAKQENAGKYGDHYVKVLGPGEDLRICASRLFRILREFDTERIEVIIAEAVSEEKLGLAIMNRLRKAAAG